jgi:cell division topological specificity factor
VSSIFQLFRRRPTADVARERLQILLAHERASVGQEGLVATLREEILAVIAKHVSVERDKVQVKLERSGEMSTLEIDIEMPIAARPRVALRA